MNIYTEEYIYVVSQIWRQRMVEPTENELPTNESIHTFRRNLLPTSELPTCDGWYFVKLLRGDEKLSKLIEVWSFDHDDKLLIDDNIGNTYELGHFKDRIMWLGPIPMPEFPEEHE